MRIVVDTNVLISAFVFPGGAPEAVYRLAIEGRVELVTSRPLLVEFAGILTRKFGWDVEPAEQATAQVARVGRVVEPAESVDEIAVDPADNRVLEAAWQGGAEVIVSGDRHLLRRKAWRGIRIRDASTFLAEFE